MEPLLPILVLVFLVAGALLHLFHRLRFPSVVGLIIAGVLIGPHGFALLQDRDQIERLAEIGIVLLMFSIGLDFTQERLQELFYAVGIGVAQMAICIVVTALGAAAWVDGWPQSLFLGFLVAHTSSTLMLKLFLDRGELTSPPVRLGLAISITQDLSVVLMLLAIPFLAGGQSSLGELGLMVLRVAAVLAVALGLSRWAIPLWMDHVIRSRSRELFLVFLMVVCLGTAWATMIAGLSIALGAFLAGIAIAESGYGHHTLSEVAPLRDLLISMFFLSIGMLLDVRGLLADAPLAALLLFAVVGLKFLSGFAPVLLWGFPLQVATTVGTAIAQVGEFSFVLGHTGVQTGLITQDQYSLFLVVAVASMLASPLLVARAPRLGTCLADLPFLRRLDRRTAPGGAAEAPPLANHVVLAGFGLNGQNLAAALKGLDIPFAVLEIDPDAVQAARGQDIPVFFGDCSRSEVLAKLHIDAARGLVLAISDARATRQAVQVARHLNPRLQIIVRTKYLSEIDPLRELGANNVVAEEFETSLEVLALTLRLFDAPDSAIEGLIRRFRSNEYRALRGGTAPADRRLLRDASTSRFDCDVVQLTPAASAVGKTLAELDPGSRSGATLVALRRGTELIRRPNPDIQLQPGDLLVFAGTADQVAAAVQLIAR